MLSIRKTLNNLVLICLLGSAHTFQANAEETYIPPELKPWVDWVLHNHPELECPRKSVSGKPDKCAWVSTLTLDVANAATFSMRVKVFGESRIDLPGDKQYWPTDVKVDGQPAVVIGGSSQPALVLAKGNYTVTGEINWGRRPNNLALPAQAGLINLTVDGRSVVRPGRNGRFLLLGKRDSKVSETQRNALSVDVYRLITDNYPMTMDTTLILSVAGQPRLVELGKTLLDGFEVTSFSSALPARLNNKGNLEIQVEPGKHSITLRARALNSPTRLARVSSTDNWPAQEVWGFAPNRNLRLVNLGGGVPIDLSQTSAPFSPASGSGVARGDTRNTEVQGYLLENDDALEFSVQQRGTPNPQPNRFSIHRDLWLTFDGTGYVVRDALDADVNHASRLSANYALGRVSVNGSNELINSLNGSAPGIELQAGSYNINSLSRVNRDDITSATGWQVNSDSLQATLHLPPGWRLLWTSGVDNSPDAWLSRWTLWKIFVLVLLGVLAWRFLSKGFAVLLIVATGLMMHSAPSLAVVWLIAIVLLATIRHLEHPGALKILRTISFIWLFVTTLAAIGEAVTHARQAVHPQLEHNSAISSYAYDGSSIQVENESLGDTMASRAIEEIVVTASRAEIPRQKAIRVQKKYSEGLQVQTGPGQPEWRWNRADLSWDGPVSTQQTLSLTLMPPIITRLINLLIAILLIGVSALLVLPLIKRSAELKLPAFIKALAPILFIGVLCLPATDTFAAEKPASAPNATLLKQLEERLLTTPVCFPNCASVEEAALAITNDQLSITLSVHSGELVSLPLPSSTIWNPVSVTVDGAAATLGKTGTGLHIALPAGRHLISMTGPVGHLERFEVGLPLSPGSVTTKPSGNWVITGLINNRVARGSLGFEREVATSVQDATLKPAPAKPFVQINRRLTFDQEWSMQTTVARQSPDQGGFSISIPLLKDEAVLNNAINVTNEQVNLVFGRTDRQISWNSRLTPTSSLELIAPSAQVAAARWTLVPSNFWHLDYTGLNPVADGSDRAGPVFLPEAGETLKLQLTQTEPVPGSTLTVERVSHRITVGARQQRHQLEISTLASQAGTLPVRLATGADESTNNELISVEVNNQIEPLSLIDGNLIALPLTPGNSNYSLTWLENTPRGMIFKVAETSLESPASNISTIVSMSRDRWVLLLGGPALGPGILYWGLLLVVLLLALLIKRIPGLPFSGADALLLSLGLSLANLPATLLVAIWVIALRFRGNLVSNLKANWTRNLMQIASAFLSVVTVVTLIASVPGALLGTPDMQVQGNGSSAYFYNWFTDQSESTLPSAWVLSLPLWVYRVIMLVWSLWLAFALIRWVPWAWQQWASPRMWYKSAKVETGTETESGTDKADSDSRSS